MSQPQFEHLTAPRLEQDVLEYYQINRSTRIPDEIERKEYQNNIDQEFKQKLSSYFFDWRIMMMAGIQEKLSYSFWVDKFFQAYCSVLNEEQIRFLDITAQRNARFYIDKIVKKLRVLFESTSLTEEMHKQNERYEKRIEKLKESYCNTSNIYPDAADLKLELSLNDVASELLDLRQLSQCFEKFQKNLANEFWYRTQAIYRFYNIFRDEQSQRYKIHFYLSFNRSLYSDPMGYCNDIRKHWMWVTQDMGICIYPESYSHLSEAEAQQAQRMDLITLEEAQCPLGEFNNMPENTTGKFGLPNRICIFHKGFQALDGAPVRR